MLIKHNQTYWWEKNLKWVFSQRSLLKTFFLLLWIYLVLLSCFKKEQCITLANHLFIFHTQLKNKVCNAWYGAVFYDEVKEVLIDSDWQKTKMIRCVTVDSPRGLKNKDKQFS